MLVADHLIGIRGGGIDVAIFELLEALRPVPDVVRDRRCRAYVVVVRIDELPLAIHRSIRIEGHPIIKPIVGAALGGVVDSRCLTPAVHGAADVHDESVSLTGSHGVPENGGLGVREGDVLPFATVQAGNEGLHIDWLVKRLERAPGERHYRRFAWNPPSDRKASGRRSCHGRMKLDADRALPCRNRVSASPIRTESEWSGQASG